MAQMKTNLEPDETLIKEGVSNLSRGIEAVGGHLYLTNRRLVFEPHAINIQKGIEIIAIPDIQSSVPCWTKLANLVPIAPNSIEVATKAGRKFRFTVYGRKAWATSIETTLHLSHA